MTVHVRMFLLSLSISGLIVGGLFVALSLTPSLVLRGAVFQGVISGILMVGGYFLGYWMSWVWTWLEIPGFSVSRRRVFFQIVASVTVFIILFSFIRAPVWQHSLREAMGATSVGVWEPFKVFLIAFLIFIFTIVLVRGLRWVREFITKKFRIVLPKKIATGLGVFLMGVFVVLLVSDVIGGLLFRMFDRTYQQLDKTSYEGIQAPVSALKSGSPDSHVSWESVGRQGQLFLGSGPTVSELTRFSGSDSQEPVRVYVGLRSAETLDERAALLLQEMERTGAFGKSTLVLATTTGTGWLDPRAIDTLEYLHGGDVSTVAVQYSYLKSWMTLLMKPDQAHAASRFIFERVYNHWTNLPKNDRPKLYLHGLSLGSLNSESSAELYTMIDDPIHGALWVGPPYASEYWPQLRAARNPDSPAWLPTFKDGSLVRFTGRENNLQGDYEPWKTLRIIYVLYPNDPVVFYSRDLWYKKPDWLESPRGEGISPSFRWYPFVTHLQVFFDIGAPVESSPPGYGHNYSVSSYIDGWVELMDLDHLGDQKVHALKQLFLDSE